MHSSSRSNRRRISQKKINKSNINQTQLPIEAIDKIKKVQAPFLIYFSSALNEFHNAVHKYINIRKLKNNPEWKPYFYNLFCEILFQVFSESLDELHLYVWSDDIYVKNLFEKVWDSIGNQRKMRRVIKEEEPLIYKQTLKLYRKHRNTKRFINRVYRRGREYNLSTIRGWSKTFIRKLVQAFAIDPYEFSTLEIYREGFRIHNVFKSWRK